MKLIALRGALLLCLINTIQCDKLSCMWGCQIPASYFVFSDDDASGGYYLLMCQGMLRVQSMYLCMREHCTVQQIRAGIAELTSECGEYGETTLLPWSVINNITAADEATLTTVTYDDLSTAQHPNDMVYQQPITFSDDLVALSLRTINVWDNSETTRARYSYAMFGFWGGILLIGLCNRLYVFMSHRTRLNKASKQSTLKKTNNSVFSSLKLWIRQHITTPAFLTYDNAQPVGWCTVPSRIQSATLIAFAIINVVLCCVSYEAFEKNLYWYQESTQLWRYIADRTGCIAMANMVLIWAFAMRNNVLIWLTGWDFKTFNQFHRWVSRIATIEAVLHSVAYTVEAFQDGGAIEYYTEWTGRYWWMGNIATIMMSILCGISIYPFRKHWYETFLLTHIFFAAWVLLSMWYHVEIFNGQYDGYIWPCVAVWSFDRALRLVRIAYVNTGSFKGTVIYSASADIVRLEVLTRSGLAPQPGCYYYVYVLNSLKFWESHPFTLSSWSVSDLEGISGSSTKLSFAIRPYDGFTARIRDQALRRKDQRQEAGSIEVPIRIAIEGPYRSAHSFYHCDSSLFIIGGSGITVALAHIRALYDILKSGQHLGLRRVHLVWAVRDYAMFQDFFDNEFSEFLLGENGLASKLEVQIDLHVTRSLKPSNVPFDSSDVDSSEKIEAMTEPGQEIRRASLKEIMVEKTQSKLTTLPRSGLPDEVRVSDERPEINEIIVSNALRYATNSQKLAVVSCGPNTMMDDSRRAVVNALGKGCDGVEFYPESFGW